MDPVKEFINDLRSPDLSIRFSVLSRIEDLAWNEQQKNTLKELIEQEQDAGLKFQMQKVLARLDRSGKCSLEEIEQLLKDPCKDELTLALMLESVKRADASLIIMSLREANWPSFSPQLLPSVLKFLKKYGSFEDVGDIEMLCRHHDPKVLVSAVEALEKIAPDRLKDLIVPLLVNSEFAIRSKAVRLLHRWDPNEALRHFEAMLFCNSQNEKQAALFQAFFFPFKQIESLLLRFISIEQDPELVKKAGFLFRANPNGQSPSRLLEARQATTGEKFKLIDDILKGVLTSLFQAGIVKATPRKMLEILENHFRQKRIRLFVERYSLGLKSGDEQVRLKSALKLCDLVRYGVEDARNLIEKYLKTERNKEVSEKVARFFESCLPAPEKNEEIDQKIEKEPERLTDEQLRLLLKSVNKENFMQIREFISSNFRNFDIEDKIRTIKAIERFGDKTDASLPKLALNSDKPQLLAAAIDCLSVIDADSLTPFLPQFIKHSSDEVRESAIKVYAMFDKKQAIALVDKMLFAVNPLQRKQGIACCVHFDFQSVGHLLIRALKLEGDPDNIQQICALLRSNADEELFYKLYADYKACKTSKEKVYEELCTQIADFLSTADEPVTKQKLYEVAIAKLEEEEKIKSQRQAYKLEKIQKIRETSEKKFEVDPSLARFTAVAYSIGAVLTAAIWFLFLAPSSAPVKVKDAQTKTVVSRFKPETIIVQGTIEKIDKKGRYIFLTNSLDKEEKQYKIKISDNNGKFPAVGDHFHGQIDTISPGKPIEAELVTAF